MANKNSRAIAAIVLSKVLSDQGSLSTELENEKSHKEFPLIQEGAWLQKQGYRQRRY